MQIEMRMILLSFELLTISYCCNSSLLFCDHPPDSRERHLIELSGVHAKYTTVIRHKAQTRAWKKEEVT